MKIAIVGTNGVPVQYGGFETLVDYLAEYLSGRYDITIYCSKDQKTRIKKYKGCKLVYLPLSANGWQGILYDNLSLLLTTFRYDKVLLLGCSSLLTIRVLSLFRNNYVLNIGGLDWKREKWGMVAKWYIYNVDKTGVQICRNVVSDNEGIREYLKDNFGRDSELIAYGGDQVAFEPKTVDACAKYSFLNKNYALVVARIQADNNIEMSMRAAIKAKYPLVVVGNWDFSQYGKDLREKYSKYENLYLLDAIYNQKELNVVRSNAHIYIHGHSGGGTNPSLCEIMHLKVPTICFNNGFNNYTTEDKALFYNNEDELAYLILNTSEERLREVASDMNEVANRRYTWKHIAEQYAEIIDK